MGGGRAPRPVNDKTHGIMMVLALLHCQAQALASGTQAFSKRVQQTLNFPSFYSNFFLTHDMLRGKAQPFNLNILSSDEGSRELQGRMDPSYASIKINTILGIVSSVTHHYQ